MIHCITIPSDSSKYKRSIVWSSIRNLSEQQTIQAFVATHNWEGGNHDWNYWKSLGYEVVPLYHAQHLLVEQLTNDQQAMFPMTSPRPFKKVEVSHETVPSRETVNSGTVCVLGDGAAQHLSQTQEGPAQTVDG